MDSEPVVVLFAGELDVARCGQVERELLEAIASGRGAVVDLAGVTFCDSNCLNAFLKAQAAAETIGAGFAFRDVPPIVSRLFEVTGLSSHLKII